MKAFASLLRNCLVRINRNNGMSDPLGLAFEHRHVCLNEYLLLLWRQPVSIFEPKLTDP